MKKILLTVLSIDGFRLYLKEGLPLSTATMERSYSLASLKLRRATVVRLPEKLSSLNLFLWLSSS